MTVICVRSVFPSFPRQAKKMFDIQKLCFIRNVIRSQILTSFFLRWLSLIRPPAAPSPFHVMFANTAQQHHHRVILLFIFIFAPFG